MPASEFVQDGGWGYHHVKKLTSLRYLGTKTFYTKRDSGWTDTALIITVEQRAYYSGMYRVVIIDRL